MTPEQQAAYIIAQSTSAMIEAMGMHAENMRAHRNGFVIVPGTVHGKADFNALIDIYGIHHNAVLTYFRG